MMILVFVLLLSVHSGRVVLNYTYPVEGKQTIAFLADYDTDLKRPHQVSFIYTCEMGKEATSKPKPPRPGFRSDPRLPRGDQAVDSDYTSSGYSRGHLGTAKFFSFNNDSYWDTFFLTNVAPQYQLFNQKWFTMDENIVLQWSADSKNCIDNLAVDVAVIGENGTIGKDKISVPNYYVDSVCEPNTGQSICFYGANVLEAEVWVYYTSVADCESKFDFKFFELDIYKPFKNCQDHKKTFDESFWGIQNLPPSLDFVQRAPQNPLF